jgi:hypothetical protein
MRPSLLVVMLFLLGASACHPPKIPPYQGWVRERAVFLNGSGKQIRLLTKDEADTASRGDELTDLEYRRYVHGVMQALRAHRTRTETTRVVMFIHGGLNSVKSSIERVHDVAQAIQNSDPNAFPLFINWDSSIGSTYSDHLVGVRQGNRPRPLEGFGFAPLVFGTDVLRGLANTPGTWVQIASDTWKDAVLQRTRNADLTRRIETDQATNPGRDSLRVISAAYDPTRFERLTSRVAAVFWFPLRLATAPLVETIGTPAWENMERRTQTVFRTPQEFESSSRDSLPIRGYHAATGGAAILLDSLKAALRPRTTSTCSAIAWARSSRTTSCSTNWHASAK